MAFILQLAVDIPYSQRFIGDFISLHSSLKELENESLIKEGYANVVEIRGHSIDELKHLSEPFFVPMKKTHKDYYFLDPEDRKFIVGESRWSFNKNKLPSSKRNELANDKVTSIIPGIALLNSCFVDRTILKESFIRG